MCDIQKKFIENFPHISIFKDENRVKMEFWHFIQFLIDYKSMTD